MTREEIILRRLDKSSKVIEIGPSFAPLAPKRDGWNTFIVDHDSREALKAKYVNDPYVADVERIEEVDHIWRGGSIADAIPVADHGTFDAFIASHVIEHTTDVVTFLEAAQRLLKPDGVVILAVPDKRKCFDFYRPFSTTGAAIAAYREKRARHKPEIYFDFGAFYAMKGFPPGWSIDDPEPKTLRVAISELLPAWERAANATSYVDAHQWVFTPASFKLMILELGALGFLDLRVEAVDEAPATEFYAWLRKGAEELSPEALADRRRALMDEIVIDLAEQSRQIADSPLSIATARVRELEAQHAAKDQEREQARVQGQAHAEAHAKAERVALIRSYETRLADAQARAAQLSDAQLRLSAQLADAQARVAALEKELIPLKKSLPKWLRRQIASLQQARGSGPTRRA
ncbi:methyltransferase domain-containing protein [Ancylobacter sp. MQZ15Z-1]|uniref:Methyltransferase domain-containing protein n=1 Tax=Ancylobacter mangrovi TaxID=2972472 RepID=A0A9X2P9C6_9HYPH|nr:methyltransferase domain-containing protein [Ancylobacter mangrovi]MCS0493765.1 methyltransferase domain-containing protein [Ancylobacter mangrovi]